MNCGVELVLGPKYERDVCVISTDLRYRNRVESILGALSISVESFHSASEIRASNRLPRAVILITAAMTAELVQSLQQIQHIERVMIISRSVYEPEIVDSLMGGATHYFDISEPDSLLNARIQAALRVHVTKQVANIVAPPFRFDVKRRLVYLHDELIALTPMEYQFAEYVFSRPDKVIPKSELMLSVWSLPTKLDARRIDTAACRVRKKMNLVFDKTGWELINARRVGYRLVANSKHSRDAWRMNAQKFQFCS